MFIVLLGAPGAGKGTQADVVVNKVGLTHLASGDMFRKAVNDGTDLGKKVKEYMNRGELVPDDVTIQLVSERLDGDDCRSGCVLDGFPRTLEQSRSLDRTLHNKGMDIDIALYIDVPEEELVGRLSGRMICKQCQTPYHKIFSPPKNAGKCDKCGGELYQRDDDKEETVRQRLTVYFAQTTPVLNYYEEQGVLKRVDGNQDIAKVSADVLKVLEEHKK